LWPSEFEFSVAAPACPVLVYQDNKTAERQLQFFDYGELDKKELTIELKMRPEACNAGTTRIFRNLELRVDAALSANPGYCIFYRYEQSETSLLMLESPRLGELANPVTIISPPPEVFQRPAITTPFVADREVFSSERIQATTLSKLVLENHRVNLDSDPESIHKLAQLLDDVHLAYKKTQDKQDFINQTVIKWAIQAGAYLGMLISQHIGARWGYIARGASRQPVVNTYHGRNYNPHLRALDHILNGSQSNVLDFFQQLLKTDVSAIPRQEDLVCNIPGFCHILQGRSDFSEGGLPLADRIPRDTLDFTVFSLRSLDVYLREVAAQFSQFSDVSLSNLTIAAGAYLGEVIRGNTVKKGAWSWVAYDDYVRDNPEFAEQRPRHLGFIAFLDSTGQTTYPLSHIMAILNGEPIQSSFDYACYLVEGENEPSAITPTSPPSSLRPADNPANSQFEGFDIQACIRDLPPEERNYPDINVPSWVSYDPLAQLVKKYSLLLKQGRVVWAHIVQINNGLFEAGKENAPGDIIYDPLGLMSPEQLAPPAHQLFALRKQQASLNPNNPEQAGLYAVAEHLNAEITRAFGMKVPAQISQQPLLLSTILFERKHLFAGKVMLPYFPVLISDQCPGFAMILPSRWWPQPLLALLQSELEASRLVQWQAAWQKSAEGRSAETERYFQGHLDKLASYARKGEEGQRAIDHAQAGMVPFQAETTPVPFEWEWALAGDLNSYACYLLEDIVGERARGLPFNSERAQLAFIANFISQLIKLHSLLLCKQRGVESESFKLRIACEIDFSVLGLAAGCEEAALASARLLCSVLQSPEMYYDFTFPDTHVIFKLFASHLGITIPELKSSTPSPHLEALLENDRWRTATEDELRPLLAAACEEHTRLTPPAGAFQGLPAAILLMLKLRDMAGLSNPALTHPLFATPIVFPASLSVEDASDALLTRVQTRLKQNGFREAAIIHAITTQTPLVIDASVGTMPLRPDLYSPTSYIQIRPIGDDEKKRKKAQGSKLFINGLGSLLGWLPCLLTCLLLISVEKETLSKLFQATQDLKPFTALLLGSWVSLPYLLLGWAMLKFKRHFISDSQLLVATLMLYYFEEATYGIHSAGISSLEGVKVFLWVPLAQMLWVCGWLYSIAKKNPEILVWQLMAISKPRLSNIVLLLFFAFVFELTATKAVSYWKQRNPIYQATCQGDPLDDGFIFASDFRIPMAIEKGYKINTEFSCIDKASYVAVNAAKEKSHQAACEEIFNTKEEIMEARSNAMTDGYEIFNSDFKCIDKAAYIAMNEDKAKLEAKRSAYNSPEAIAKRKQEEDKRMADLKLWQEEVSRKDAEEETQRQARMAAIITNGLPKVDVNTATEAELAQVISLKHSSEVVAQIITERNKRAFESWPDLVHRVVGLSAAQTAVYASICGLTVKGESLKGAPANAQFAAMLNEKLQR
jgi:DNA uptake protein ComE-like DNA-binding protein